MASCLFKSVTASTNENIPILEIDQAAKALVNFEIHRNIFNRVLCQTNLDQVWLSISKIEKLAPT